MMGGGCRTARGWAKGGTFVEFAGKAGQSTYRGEGRRKGARPCDARPFRALTYITGLRQASKETPRKRPVAYKPAASVAASRTVCGTDAVPPKNVTR